MTLGNDEITVSTHQIAQINTSIWSALLKSKTTYAIGDIKVAIFPLQEKSSITDIGAALLLISFLPKRKRPDKQLTIKSELKNGQEITIMTSLEESKVLKIVTLINSIV